MEAKYVLQMLDSWKIAGLTDACKREIAIKRGREKSGLAYERALKTIYKELRSKEFSKFPTTGLYKNDTGELWMQGTCYVIRFREGVFNWVETKGTKRFPFRSEWITEKIEPDETRKGLVRYGNEWFDTKRIGTIEAIIGSDWMGRLTASLFMRGHHALVMQTARGMAWLMPYLIPDEND